MPHYKKMEDDQENFTSRKIGDQKLKFKIKETKI